MIFLFKLKKKKNKYIELDNKSKHTIVSDISMTKIFFAKIWSLYQLNYAIVDFLTKMICVLERFHIYQVGSQQYFHFPGWL